MLFQKKGDKEIVNIWGKREGYLLSVGGFLHN
jgi:hypothetical protein